MQKCKNAHMRDCVSLQFTTPHRTGLIIFIFPLIIQISIRAQILAIGGEKKLHTNVQHLKKLINIKQLKSINCSYGLIRYRPYKLPTLCWCFVLWS